MYANERVTTTVERNNFLLLLHVRTVISARTLYFNKDKNSLKRESSATNEKYEICLVLFVVLRSFTSCHELKLNYSFNFQEGMMQ